jgi:hypothetical protein
VLAVDKFSAGIAALLRRHLVQPFIESLPGLFLLAFEKAPPRFLPPVEFTEVHGISFRGLCPAGRRGSGGFYRWNDSAGSGWGGIGNFFFGHRPRARGGPCPKRKKSDEKTAQENFKENAARHGNSVSFRENFRQGSGIRARGGRFRRFGDFGTGREDVEKFVRRCRACFP